MISIVVSSYKPEFYKKFAESVEQTVGVDFEIIRIDNPGTYSLAEAYCIGSEKSKYEYVCFVHEDVVFMSLDWGKEAISIIQKDTSVGLIGVAGGKFKSSLATGWYDMSLNTLTRGRIIQGINSYENSRITDFDYTENKKDIEDVVCLDGVFLFTTKQVLQQCKFDKKRLTGFHGYDIDFSLQCFFAGFRVVVDRKIEIYHYSIGLFSKDYAKYAWIISRKWLGKLPVATKDLNFTMKILLVLEAKLYINFFLPGFKKMYLKYMKK